jgi:hypothetical protein
VAWLWEGKRKGFKHAEDAGRSYCNEMGRVVISCDFTNINQAEPLRHANLEVWSCARDRPHRSNRRGRHFFSAVQLLAGIFRKQHVRSTEVAPLTFPAVSCHFIG